MATKRKSSSGRYERVVESPSEGAGPTKVTIVRPKKAPTSTSLSNMRRALREVHGSTKDK